MAKTHREKKQFKLSKKRMIVVSSTAVALLLLVSSSAFAYNAFLKAKETAQLTSETDKKTDKKTVFNTPRVIPLPLATDVEANVNQLRLSKGLSALSDNPVLDQAAQVRADGMCADNNWSHNGDWALLNQYYVYITAGENLYYGSLQDNQAADAVQVWSLSPKHLANIVKDYTEFGIAVKSCPGFQSDPTAVIITNYFGVPR